MANISPVCPICNSIDQCSKVSLIYLECSSWLNNKQSETFPHAQQVLSAFTANLPQATPQRTILSNLVNAFAPPSGEKHLTRRVHPDIYVGVFGLTAAVILYRMTLQQPEMLIYAIVLILAALILYMATRNTIIVKYRTFLQEEAEHYRRIQRTIALWMQVYYCARDQIVFFPGKSTYAPLGELRNFLRDA